MELSESIQAAVDLISHWHLESGINLILDSGPFVKDRYLKAVDQILLSAQGDELKDVIFMAVARLKLEFETILFNETRSSHIGILAEVRGESLMGSSAIHEYSYSMTDSSSYGDYTNYEFGEEDDLLLQYLRKIAERMNSCGHLAECTLIYSQVRKTFVDAILEELKVGDHVKRLLDEELKMVTKRWIQAAKVCTNLLFAKEKKTAELIFGGLGTSIADKSFMLVMEDAVVNLFRFVEILISSHQSSERLDIILILYDGFLSLVPDMNLLFPFESAIDIRSRLAGILLGIQNEVRRMLSDYENAVLHEKSMISNEVGHVHLLTKNVMWYINLLVNYRELLMSLIASKPISSLNYSDELQDPDGLSPLSLHIVSIIAVLQLNLEYKSKKYKKASFSYMFMVNNIQFIILSIEKSRDLKELVGTDHLKKLTENLERAIYEWQGLMLHCLNEEDLYLSLCFCHGVSRSAFTKKVKTFNGLCEDIHIFQSLLEMDNPSLWEEICKSSIEKLVPAYESFLRKFRGHLKRKKNRKLSILSFQKVSINYTVQELEALFYTRFHFPVDYTGAFPTIMLNVR